MSVNFSIDLENLFRDKLQDGICLFTGAGFSILPNDSGKFLPRADDLVKDIVEEFNIKRDFGKDLESLSTFAENQFGSRYQNYLRNKYTIDGYNPKYDVINKINLKSIITTNVDNLIPKVIGNSPNYYLNNIQLYGTTRGERVVNYIPIHGYVKDYETPLAFGKFDLALVDKRNRDLFEIAYADLRLNPVLFWGYGIHDSGVLAVISRLIQNQKNDIWIQFYDESDPKIELYRQMGCKIIIADTEALLDWIDIELHESDESETEQKLTDELSEFRIPALEETEAAVKTEDYYQNLSTTWFNVWAKHPFERKIINQIENDIITHKHIAIIGIGVSGKSTCLMQLAIKLYVNNINQEKVKFILNHLNGSKATVFIEDFSDDVEAYNLFLSATNISTVSVAESVVFESARHLVDLKKVSIKSIDEIDELEAQQIFLKIPESIRKDKFIFKSEESEKYGMLELISSNVPKALSEAKVKSILSKIDSDDVFAVIVLASYLTRNKSLLSTDILLAFFGYSYQDSCDIIRKAESLLADSNLYVTEERQDYYVLRSNLFAQYVNNVLLRYDLYRNKYVDILVRFFNNVSQYIIFNYNVFKRTAYDAAFFHKLFFLSGRGPDADKVYENLLRYSDNPYLLQQWALYKSRTNSFKEAFILIDKALNKMPNNFSMKNTGAIISFEANKHSLTPEGKKERDDAMKILEDCYKSDKRKIYHAQKFSGFAIDLYKFHHDNRYISKAKMWIEELQANMDYSSDRTKALHRDLSSIVRNLEPEI